MTKKQLGFKLCIAACAMLYGATIHAELKVGDPAPNFTLKGSDGETYKLSELTEEQPVIVAWFPKAFTGG